MPGSVELNHEDALIFDTCLLRVTGRVERDGQVNCTKLEGL